MWVDVLCLCERGFQKLIPNGAGEYIVFVACRGQTKGVMLPGDHKVCFRLLLSIMENEGVTTYLIKGKVVFWLLVRVPGLNWERTDK